MPRTVSGFWRSSGLKESDYWPNAIGPQKLGSHLFAMPLDYGMWMLQYNKELFDRAHLRYPDLSWTWDTFVRVCRLLTRDNKGRNPTHPKFDPHHVVQYGNDGGLTWSWNVLLRSQGLYQERLTPPYTLGAEVAGVVVRAPASTEFQPGDRVAGTVTGAAAGAFGGDGGGFARPVASG